MARRKPTTPKTSRGVRKKTIPRETALPVTEGTSSPPASDRFVPQVADPVMFWIARLEDDQWQTPRLEGALPALKRLGPMPFARSGFPLMGLLATVYEQVASYAAAMISGASHSSRELDQN